MRLLHELPPFSELFLAVLLTLTVRGGAATAPLFEEYL